MMKKHFSLSLVPILLFTVFTVAVLSALSLGASVYGKSAERAESSFNLRSATQFIMAKIEQAESPDNVFAGDLSGVPSITITSSYDGVTYYTCIYAYEGYLCELFYPDGVTMKPSDGERILPLSSLDVKREGALLVAKLCFDGEKSETLYFDLGTGVQDEK